MSYIVVVNPSILATPGTGMSFSGVLAAAVSAFLTLMLIPVTFSTQGILWGFISHTGFYTLAGRQREIPAVLYALAAISAGLLILEHT